MNLTGVKVQMFPCGKTILIVFMVGVYVLFRIRFTLKGAQEVCDRLAQLLVIPRHTSLQD